jgi:hypothetical protein
MCNVYEFFNLQRGGYFDGQADSYRRSCIVIRKDVTVLVDRMRRCL